MYDLSCRISLGPSGLFLRLLFPFLSSFFLFFCIVMPSYLPGWCICLGFSSGPGSCRCSPTTPPLPLSALGWPCFLALPLCILIYARLLSPEFFMPIPIYWDWDNILVKQRGGRGRRKQGQERRQRIRSGVKRRGRWGGGPGKCRFYGA